MVRAGDAGVGGQLPGSGRAGPAAARGHRKSALPPRAGLGVGAHGSAGDVGYRDCFPGTNLRRLFGRQAVNPAWLPAAHAGALHVRAGGGADLHRCRQLVVVGRRRRRRGAVPQLGRAGRRLWHLGQPANGDHHLANVFRRAPWMGLSAAGGTGGNRPVFGGGSVVLCLERPQDRRWRLVPAAHGGTGVHRDDHLEARTRIAHRKHARSRH